MKKSTVITVLAFALGLIVLATGFILFTENDIPNKIFATTTTTTQASSGSSDPVTYEPMDLFEVDVTKYITLGQYKGLDVKVDDVEVSQDLIDREIYYMLYQNKAFTKNETGSVKEGKIFNFNYTGLIDAVAFEGGSASNVDAYIMGDQFILTDGTTFIPGFAEGILGAKAGKEFSIFVTFPENYTEELAGKKAEFRIKINYIVEAELTDEWVKTNTGGAYNTAKEFEKYAREYYESNLKSYNTALILSEISKNATFIEIPKQEYDYFYNYYTADASYYAEMLGMTLDQFLATGYGSMLGIEFTSVDQIKEYVENTVKEELVLYAILVCENIQYTQEEYNELLNQTAAAEGLTAAELIEKYTAETVHDYVHETLLLRKVEEFVYESNNLLIKD